VSTTARRLGQGVAGAAVLIAVITIAARVTGFGKQLAFARTVGTNCLATAYYTANQVPNLVFELVVGGALAGMVVPVLAGAAARSLGDGPDAAAARAEAGHIASALLTWVLVLLVPLAVLVALAAGPVIGLFTGGDVAGCDTAAVVDVATRMLVVFAPQIPLYGLAVVLYGVLQAHRRFGPPALAPLVSSLVVIVAYLAFPALSGGVRDVGAVPAAAELVLSVGTTLGVLSLVLTVVGPAARLRLPLRPTLRFPGGVAARVRRLALAGLAGLVAQQLAMAAVILLANREIGGGALAAYSFAWAIYQVPYAVLAVPIATSAFPALSAQADGRDGDPEAFARLAAQTTRAVVLVSGLAAGVLAAAAAPIAQVFIAGMGGNVPAPWFARAIALFAPGLVGYGLIAHLSRVLYATGRGRAAATGTVAGWGVVIVAQAAFAVALPQDWKLGGLAAGSAVGMTAGAAVLLVSVVRDRGARAVAGLPRAVLAALAGGLAGWLAGAGVVALAGDAGVWGSVAVTVLAALAAGLAGVAVAAATDPADVRAALARVRPRGGGGWTARSSGEDADG
jgi:putative peptidoglycan lipid II flippase